MLQMFTDCTVRTLMFLPCLRGSKTGSAVSSRLYDMSVWMLLLSASVRPWKRVACHHRVWYRR